MSNYTDLFKSIKKILEKDSVLCNYFRYVDYGELKKINTSNTIWNSIDDECINYDNRVNKTQCIRFVSKLDVKFLKNLYSYNFENNTSSDRNNIDRISDPIKHFWNYVSKIDFRNAYNTRLDNLNNGLDYLYNKMVNIDCTFEIKGSSLTALDFAGKNSKFSAAEYTWWNNFLFSNIKKLIFVGDKCFLLGLVDSYNNIWVSSKVLQSIETNKNISKEKFQKLILKLFGFLNFIIVNNLKFTIPQYINNEIIVNVYKKFILDSDNISLQHNSDDLINILDFAFSEDEDINLYIKENIKDLVYQSVCECVNKNYKFECFNIGDYLQSLHNMYMDTINKSNNISFMNGLLVYSVINQIGWNCVCNVVEDPNYNKLNLDPSKQYIYKDVNIVPLFGVISDYDNYDYFNKRNVGYRKIKDEYANNIKDYAYITRLYIEMSSGTMMAVGYHPNVSSGHQVCMGDLKGKVSFSNTSDKELIEIIKACEELLYTINYTSSYTDHGKKYFLNNTYSTEAFMENSNVTEKDKNESVQLIKDVTSISDDGFEEMDGEEDNINNNSNSNEPQDFESDDFEENVGEEE